MAPHIVPYVFGALTMLAGFLLLNKRMKKYIAVDLTRYLQFSTDKDAEIVFWQRIGVLINFGILPNVLAILVLALE